MTDKCVVRNLLVPVLPQVAPLLFELSCLRSVAGAMGGYLVGLTSIGSGSVMAVILLILYPMAPAVIVGTDIAHATVLSFVVGLAHMTQGNVDFGLAGSLLLGGVPGVLVGSRLAPWVPGKPLKMILAAMLIFVGLRLLLAG